MKAITITEVQVAPCGCEHRLASSGLRLWIYCAEHFAQAEASTPIENIYGEPATPCIKETVDAVSAGLQAIRKWNQ